MLPATADAPFVIALHEALRVVHGGAFSMPSTEVLADAVSHAHRLSTQLYEGRPVRSSLLLVRDPRTPIPAGVTLRGAGPAKAQLRSLCAAFPGGVVLVPSGDGRRCELHAALPLPGLGLPPAVAELRFRCPGVVSVLAKDFLVAVTRAGEKPTVFELPVELERLIAAATARPRRRSDPLPSEWEPAVTPSDALTVLRAMHEVGSGGTLVVCPAGAELASFGSDVHQLSGAHSAEWRFAGDQARHLRNPQAIDDMIGASFAGTGILKVPEARAHWTNQIRANTQALLEASLEAVGRLARADGAVFLRRDMALLGFGLRLAASPKPKGKPRYVDLEGHELGEPSAGTRLQASIAFVAAHPDCVAFVLSADGPLRMVSAVKDQLVVQTELEAFL